MKTWILTHDLRIWCMYNYHWQLYSSVCLTGLASEILWATNTVYSGEKKALILCHSWCLPSIWSFSLTQVRWGRNLVPAVPVGINVLKFTSSVSYAISPLTYTGRSEWFTITVGLENDSQKSKPSSTSISHCNKIFYYYGFKCPAVYGNSDIK